MNRIFFLIVAFICLTGCQEKDAPLQKAIENVESSWSPDKLKEFGAKPDSVALPEVHFGQALAFRNEYLRSPKDSTLLKYFHSLGIYHEDYMSGIVFTSLHRKLNGEPIDLDTQIANIHTITDKVKKRENKNILRAKGYYSKYQIEDTIVVRMPVENESAYNHSFPESSNWVYNDSLDLLIKGTIKEKSKTEDYSDMLFKLKILSMNRDSVQVLMEDVNVGDEIDVDLKHNIVESIN